MSTSPTGRNTRKLMLLATAFSSPLFGQPPSIGTVTLPITVSGPSIFNSAGEMYTYQRGPATAGAFQTTNGGGTCLFSNGFFAAPGPCTDAYVGKLDASGNLIFGTYLGGNTNDAVTAIAVDPTGNIFITGTTGGGFPTTGNAAIPASTTSRSFAAKFNPDGSRLLYSTYLPDSDV